MATATKTPDLDSTSEERGFLQGLTDGKPDLTKTLVYADWIEEAGRLDVAQAIRAAGPESVGGVKEEWGGFEIWRGHFRGKVYGTARRIGSSAFKSLWNYSFRSIEQREQHIAGWKLAELKRVEARATRAAAKKAASAGFINPYKPGDIFYTSWGYDQTNVNWFQAVKVGPKSVTLREIAGNSEETGFMSGQTTPCPGEFLAPRGGDSERGLPILVVIQLAVYDGKVRHHLPASDSRGSYYKWEGGSHYWSSYA